ncbi:MAG: type I restriction-modification system subunit M N-terminal domain-containing protein [Eubacteriales bacterium]|nr:type I restriction-modification system subunit M N-terminal domain-containing protein [Eubacteriales bacterium]
MADNNTALIGFEKQIWDAACLLRGNIDASEYKSVVLGFRVRTGFKPHHMEDGTDKPRNPRH